MSDDILSGRFRGVVSDRNDPEKRGRVRCRIPDLFLDPERGEVIDSPWCETTGSHGDGIGVFHVPPLGAPVWVTTTYSELGVAQLVYEPGRHGLNKDETARSPAVARGEEDETTGKLKAGTAFKVPSADAMLALGTRPAKSGDVTIDGIPGSTTNASQDSPDNVVFKSRGGITIELDDAEGSERLHIWHPEGFFLEVSGKGVRVTRQEAKWEEITEHDTSYVGGDRRERVNGNHVTGVGHNRVEQVDGRSLRVAREVHTKARSHLVEEVGGRRQMSVNGTSSEACLSDRQVTVGGKSVFGCAGRAAAAFGDRLDVAVASHATAVIPGSVTITSPFVLFNRSVPLEADAVTVADSAVAKAAPIIELLEMILNALSMHVHQVEPGAPATLPSADFAALILRAQTRLEKVASLCLGAS